MTKQLVTATPDTPVTEIVQMMMDHRISAVPVVEAEQRLLGIISETDLLQRHEVGMEGLPRFWWLALFNSKDRLTRSVDKTEGNFAKNIMTTPAISVDQEASIEDVARLFLTRKINQAPVVHRGKLVGIVSRGDLVAALAHSD